MLKHVRLFVFLVVIGMILSISIIQVVAQEAPEADVNVVVIFAQHGSDKGWNLAHEIGVQTAASDDRNVIYINSDSIDTATHIVYELEDGTIVSVRMIPDAFYDNSTIEPKVLAAIAGGADMIICNWFDSFDVCSSLAQKNAEDVAEARAEAEEGEEVDPEILFVHFSGLPVVSSFKPNFMTVFPRKYQSDYPNCYLAGRMGFSKMGTVATRLLPEPVRGVVSCFLGWKRGLEEAGFDSSQAVNYLYWMDEWLNPEKERSAALAFADDADADTENWVIAQWADTQTVAITAHERGIPALGYGLAVDTALASSTWIWAPYYAALFDAAADRSLWEVTDWWGGFEDGVTGIEISEDLVPVEIRNDTLAIVEQMRRGEFDPFCGPLELELLGQEGIINVSLADDECLSDPTLLSFQLFHVGMDSILPNMPVDGYLIEVVPMDEREFFGNFSG